MRIRGWIRIDDVASCGGVVAEGSPSDFSDGKALAFQGARVSCPSRCVIAEGYASCTLANGHSQVLDGQETSGGCKLVSTLNGVDGIADAQR